MLFFQTCCPHIVNNNVEVSINRPCNRSLSPMIRFSTSTFESLLLLVPPSLPGVGRVSPRRPVRNRTNVTPHFKYRYLFVQLVESRISRHKSRRFSKNLRSPSKIGANSCVWCQCHYRLKSNREKTAIWYMNREM